MRALLSVYDKSGIIDFARELADLGFELVSTGGTFAALESAGLNVTRVSEVTGFPEILDGRVKTLHPSIHGGLLARTELPEHVDQLREHDITPIDLLAVNLYPFEETIAKPNVPEEEAVEQIDIGGPAMLRAAAKNFRNVIVVTDPSDYPAIANELKNGAVPISRRREFAAKGFAHVAAYDNIVANYLATKNGDLPERFIVDGRKVRELRYGENPQQRAAVYLRSNSASTIRRLERGAIERKGDSRSIIWSTPMLHGRQSNDLPCPRWRLSNTPFRAG